MNQRLLELAARQRGNSTRHGLIAEFSMYLSQLVSLMNEGSGSWGYRVAVKLSTAESDLLDISFEKLFNKKSYASISGVDAPNKKRETSEESSSPATKLRN